MNDDGQKIAMRGICRPDGAGPVDGVLAIKMPLHEQWRENRKKQRSSLEEVWKRIHQPFPFLKSKKPVRIPPMPKPK